MLSLCVTDKSTHILPKAKKKTHVKIQIDTVWPALIQETVRHFSSQNTVTLALVTQKGGQDKLVGYGQRDICIVVDRHLNKSLAIR